MDETTSRHSPRSWLALGLIAVSYFLAKPFEAAVYHLLAHSLGVHGSAPDTLGQAFFGTDMLVRLIWDSILWVSVCAALGHSPTGFPLRDKQTSRHLLIGLATGWIVMLATMLGIWALRAATVSTSGQGFNEICRNGFHWLLLDGMGALGEELYGRAVILVVAERFLGWEGAVLVSGLVFSGIHIANPGATWVWLLRLFLQGAVLAYAVFRTRSLWWSVGYHTGWNWVSAPLFGAAGSGYLNEGHILNFFPRGSVWITGGAVGPEGSIFAFVAVFAALWLLVIATDRRAPRPLA